MDGRATMSYPRETTEFQPVNVQVDGVEVTTNLDLTIVPNGQRPSVWAAPYALDGKTGVMITGLAPGLYRIWARVTDNPEVVVIDCGMVVVS